MYINCVQIAPFTVTCSIINSPSFRDNVATVVLVITSPGSRGIRHAPGTSGCRRLEVAQAARGHIASSGVLWEDIRGLGHVLRSSAAVPGPPVGFPAGLWGQMLSDVFCWVRGGGARGCSKENGWEMKVKDDDLFTVHCFKSQVRARATTRECWWIYSSRIGGRKKSSQRTNCNTVRCRQITWQVDCLVSQEEASGDASAVPRSGEGQDLTQPSHVVLEGSRANVTHS